jgi:leucyl-tRNA synthetase
MFMGPLTATKPWQTASISGVHRFLKRVWRLVVDEDGNLSSKLGAASDSEAFQKVLHKTIKKVTVDTEALGFNTAIAAMMELVNAAYKEPQISKQAVEAIVLLVSPYAPHLGEELWERLGHGTSLAYAPWPAFDPALVVEDDVVISVQGNGKLRGTHTVPKTLAKDAVLSEAKALEAVQRQLEGKSIAKEIFVPGKIVNFVVK